MAPFLKYIRFPTMNSDELAAKVVPSGLLTSEQTLELFSYLTKKSESKSGSARLGSSILMFNPKVRLGTNVMNFWNINDRGNPHLELASDRLTTSSREGGTSNYGIRSQFGYVSGKHSWEIKMVFWASGGNGYNTAGVCLKDAPLTAGHGYPLSAATGKAWMVDMHYVYKITGSSHGVTSYGNSGIQLKTGDVVGFYLDLDNGTLTIFLNGSMVGTPYTELKDKGRLFPVVAMGRMPKNIYLTNFQAKPPY